MTERNPRTAQKRRRVAVIYTPGPPIPRNSVQVLMSVYEPGDCLVIHDAGQSLYVPSRWPMSLYPQKNTLFS